jgi:hypothetical protein
LGPFLSRYNPAAIKRTNVIPINRSSSGDKGENSLLQPNMYTRIAPQKAMQYKKKGFIINLRLTFVFKNGNIKN